MGGVHETNGEVKGKSAESTTQVHSRGMFLPYILIAKGKEAPKFREKEI